MGHDNFNLKITNPSQPQSARPVQSPSSSSLVNKIQETRNTIKAALSTEAAQQPSSTAALERRIESVENENKQLRADLACK